MKNKFLFIFCFLFLCTISMVGCNRECQHVFIDEYNYETKEYHRECNLCDYSENLSAGNDEQFPLLARDEEELASVISVAQLNCFIKLVNDIAITNNGFTLVHRLPDGGTLDLGGNTITVNHNGGLIIEGKDVIIQNGNIETNFANPKSGYALFIGDIGENNSAVVKNIHSKGGFNVYNSIATIYNCVVDASEHTYYSLWADKHSTINVESGDYYGGEIACVNSTTGEIVDGEDGRGIININGGSFHGKIIATDLTTISGGEFTHEIVLTPYRNFQAKLIVSKNYEEELNIISSSSNYEIVSSVDENGNFVYQTIDKDSNAQ